MLSARFKPWHVPLFAVKYARLKWRGYPKLVHFEVTMRCNARCNFCDYWKTPSEERAHELKSYADAARFFDPMIVCFTGGEPLLRRDLEDLVRAVSEAVRLKYMTLITHGGMLTPERGLSLWNAGINQIGISLDFLDERHDVARGIPGLVERIMAAIPGMRARGIDNIRFNTVIKNSNLDQIVPIARRARELGVGVNFSVYTDFKNGNREYLLAEDSRVELASVIAELRAFKRADRRVITNSDWYLAHIPEYVNGRLDPQCFSGVRTIHVNPTGHVRRCPDFPADFHWKDFRPYAPIRCNACFYACRGEAQAPLNISRLRDVIA
jgi:MoaA/NifB/PqqE/SkfB family radical SAM enzyme